jgi:hypothetical protein
MRLKLPQSVGITLAVCLVSCLSLSTPHILSAQSRRDVESARRVPVTVVLVDSLPGSGVEALILRRPSVQPHDVILLRSASADGTALATAALQLLLIRDRAGDVPTSASTFRIREGSRGGRALEREIGSATRIVDRLRTKQPRTVPGLPEAVRATDIYLPSQLMRNEMKANQRLRFGPRP